MSPLFLSIISGAQPGAERAALEWAAARGIRTGGWCPKGRRCEEGIIPASYRLAETDRCDYKQHVRWNVRDSDATILITLSGKVSGYARFAAACAEAAGKPFLHISGRDRDPGSLLAEFVEAHRAESLHVTGSRASREPGVAAVTPRILDAMLLRLTAGLPQPLAIHMSHPEPRQRSIRL